VAPSPLLDIIRHYFAEELKQGWVFTALGVAATLAGSWLWKSQGAFRHALWPLLVVAAVQLAVGGVVLLRTPPRAAEIETQLGADPAGFRASEVLRLTQSLDAFRFCKLAEIAAVLAAIALALFLPHNDAARGWALGLLLQSSFMLAASLVAEQRAEVYLDALRRL